MYIVWYHMLDLEVLAAIVILMCWLRDWCWSVPTQSVIDWLGPAMELRGWC